jgi:hypothetical protein
MRFGLIASGRRAAARTLRRRRAPVPRDKRQTREPAQDSKHYKHNRTVGNGNPSAGGQVGRGAARGRRLGMRARGPEENGSR